MWFWWSLHKNSSNLFFLRFLSGTLRSGVQLVYECGAATAPNLVPTSLGGRCFCRDPASASMVNLSQRKAHISFNPKNIAIRVTGNPFQLWIVFSQTPFREFVVSLTFPSVSGLTCETLPAVVRCCFLTVRNCSWDDHTSYALTDFHDSNSQAACKEHTSIISKRK